MSVTPEYDLSGTPYPYRLTPAFWGWLESYQPELTQAIAKHDYKAGQEVILKRFPRRFIIIFPGVTSKECDCFDRLVDTTDAYKVFDGSPESVLGSVRPRNARAVEDLKPDTHVYVDAVVNAAAFRPAIPAPERTRRLQLKVLKREAFMVTLLTPGGVQLTADVDELRTWSIFWQED